MACDGGQPGNFGFPRGLKMRLKSSRRVRTIVDVHFIMPAPSSFISIVCDTRDVKSIIPEYCSQSMRHPKNTAPMTIDRMYMTSVRKPRPLRMTRMLAMLHAGPAMRSTSAAPGVSPFSMSTTAIGIDPVAHRYHLQ